MSREITRVMFTGATETGKTKLIAGISGDDYDSKYTPTIGADYRYKVLERKNGEINKLVMWDSSSQERYYEITINYFRRVDVIALCVDLSDADFAANAEAESKSIEYLKNTVANDLPESANILVAFTKSDNPERQKPTAEQLKAVSDRVMRELEIPKQRQCEHVVTSAKEGTGYKEVVAAIENASRSSSRTMSTSVNISSHAATSSVSRTVTALYYKGVLNRIIGDFEGRVNRESGGDKNSRRWSEADKNKLTDLHNLLADTDLTYRKIENITSRRTHRHSHNPFTQFFARRATTSTRLLKELVPQESRRLSAK